MFPRGSLASRTPTEESMKGRKTKRSLAEKGLARDTQGRLERPYPKEPTVPKVLHRPGTPQRLASWMAWLCSRAKFVDLTDSCSHNKLFPQGFPKNPSKSLTPFVVNKGGSRCGLKLKCESCSSYQSYCSCVYDFAVKKCYCERQTWRWGSSAPAELTGGELTTKLSSAPRGVQGRQLLPKKGWLLGKLYET